MGGVDHARHAGAPRGQTADESGHRRMGVDDVELPAAKSTAQLQAGLSVGALALSPVERENFHVDGEGAEILDQVSHEAARHWIRLAWVHVGEAQNLHPRISGS